MQKKIEFKNNVLKASVKLFEIHGYVNTTTRMIADEAGVGRGHLSYYFPKKEDIARELLLMFICKIERFINKKISDECREAFTYFGFLLKCFEHFSTSDDYFKMMMAESVQIKSIYQTSCDNYYNIIKRFTVDNSVHYDDDVIKRSLEFCILIFDHQIIKKINGDIELNSDASSKALEHFFLEMGKYEDVGSTLKIIKSNFLKLDMKAFTAYINEYNYEEIYLSE